MEPFKSIATPGMALKKRFLTCQLPKAYACKQAAMDALKLRWKTARRSGLPLKQRCRFQNWCCEDSGVRASTAQLTLGTAYFNVLHKKKEEVRVAFAHQSIDVDHEVRFRVSVDLATAKVSVFKGELKIPNAVETAILKKEQTATFDLVDEKQVATAKGIETLPRITGTRNVPSFRSSTRDRFTAARPMELRLTWRTTDNIVIYREQDTCGSPSELPVVGIRT